jgi:hypothetical protein
MVKDGYSFHALKDFWLGGYQAVVRLHGREVYRSPNSYGTRAQAVSMARAQHRNTFRRF